MIIQMKATAQSVPVVVVFSTFSEKCQDFLLLLLKAEGCLQMLSDRDYKPQRCTFLCSLGIESNRKHKRRGPCAESNFPLKF